MNLRRFGDFAINLEKITYIHRFHPQLGPPIPGTSGRGGVRIFFESQDLTIYEDEPGYDELLNWFEDQPLP